MEGPPPGPGFQELLQQLREAHERELARALAQQHAPAAPREQPVAGWTSISDEGEREEAPASPTEEERSVAALRSCSDEGGVVVRQFAGSRTVRTSETRREQQGLSQLHPQWTMGIENLNLAGRYALLLPTSSQMSRSWTPKQSEHGDTGAFMRNVLHWAGFWAQLLWDFVGILCIIADLVWIPVQICFELGVTASETHLEWSLRCFWSVDLLLKAWQTCGQKNSPCKHLHHFDGRWALAKSKWLAFDFLMVLLDWIPAMASAEDNEDGASGALGLLRIGKVPRILRILRVLRLAWMMKLQRFFLALGDNLLVSSEQVSLFLGLFRNTLCVLFWCHLCTCVWFMVGNGKTDNNWVYYYGLHEPETPLAVKYIWSFHWVAAQWTPATTEILPRSDGERAFSAVLVVGGVMMFSTFMGAITASMTRLRNISGNELAQSFLLRHYLHENRISRDLTLRVCRYADLASDMRRRRIDQECVRHLKLLSGPLRVELQKEIYLPHLRRHCFFAGYLDWDASAMSHLCSTALSREFFAKDDTLFSDGAQAPKMYCTVAGTFIYQRSRGVKVLTGQRRPRRTVRVPGGTWACEAALWVRWQHRGSMCALVESEVLQVDAEKFREVTRSRASVFSRSALYARAFSRNMYDENECAWDLPAEMMYSMLFRCGSRQGFWWQRESVDAEIAEAEWLAQHMKDEEISADSEEVGIDQDEKDEDEEEEQAEQPMKHVAHIMSLDKSAAGSVEEGVELDLGKEASPRSQHSDDVIFGRAEL